eukprot:TRINITY_DN522_c0_g1_i1.p1 TRINITY_DN522_c0_g1~~TRINITY_DN522_c0_g1_i1.p1  ORF type:complete len:168 (+),score=24.69 TRINITY_DN522_c0_g1_i1:537-1040(+)
MLRIVNAISVASRRVPKTLKSKKGLFASIKKTNAPSRSFVTSIYQKEKTKKMLSLEEIAVGLERDELEAEAKGRHYIQDDILRGPFGTPDNPVIVPSAYDVRIVGCMGGPGPLAHELLWHNLKKDKPLSCLECGQVFKMIPLEEYERQHGGSSVTHHHEHNHPAQKH